MTHSFQAKDHETRKSSYPTTSWREPNFKLEELERLSKAKDVRKNAKMNGFNSIVFELLNNRIHPGNIIKHNPEQQTDRFTYENYYCSIKKYKRYQYPSQMRNLFVGSMETF